jgi:glycerophosphoryl diester phosphodiesterase
MLIVAHRGNRKACPENTPGAFERAIQEGADLIETDIRLSVDGAFVCIHDGTLERTTEGRGRVAESTLRAICGVNVRPVPGHDRPEHVPSLEEFASLLPEGVGAALELKDPKFAEPEVCAKFAGELRRLGLSSRTIALSMTDRKIRALRSVAPELPVGVVSLAVHPPASVDLLGPYWPIIVLNPAYVRRAHARGMIVCPLDPCPDSRLRLYRRLGCEAVLTDDPAATISALRRIESAGG